MQPENNPERKHHTDPQQPIKIGDPARQLETNCLRINSLPDLDGFRVFSTYLSLGRQLATFGKSIALLNNPMIKPVLPNATFKAYFKDICNGVFAGCGFIVFIEGIKMMLNSTPPNYWATASANCWGTALVGFLAMVLSYCLKESRPSTHQEYLRVFDEWNRQINAQQIALCQLSHIQDSFLAQFRDRLGLMREAPQRTNSAVFFEYFNAACMRYAPSSSKQINLDKVYFQVEAALSTLDLPLTNSEQKLQIEIRGVRCLWEVVRVLEQVSLAFDRVARLSCESENRQEYLNGFQQRLLDIQNCQINIRALDDFKRRALEAPSNDHRLV